MKFLTSRLALLAAPLSVVIIWIVAFTLRGGNLLQPLKPSQPPQVFAPNPTHKLELPPAKPPFDKPSGDNGFKIQDKVAMISDTQFTPRLIPLILHYHAVLGPSWPIVFYTSQPTYDEHFSPDAKPGSTSAIWQRAVSEGAIDVRIISEQFDLTQREGVNIFLSKPWLWEQLAPAKNVLVFQADSIMCANARHTVDEFLQFDFIGAIFYYDKPIYNGGLSLRNRTMILDILGDGRDWERETNNGEWKSGGEDVWFSALMGQRGATLPVAEDALEFSLEFNNHIDRQKEPLGYHKVHKNAPDRIDEIREWCPEIDLAAPGTLEASE